RRGPLRSRRSRGRAAADRGGLRDARRRPRGEHREGRRADLQTPRVAWRHEPRGDEHPGARLACLARTIPSMATSASYLEEAAGGDQPPDTIAALLRQSRGDLIDEWWQAPTQLFAPPELAGPF